MGVREALQHLDSERETWLNLVAQMVNVDSGPGDADGADRMVEILSSAWSDIRCSVEVVPGDSPLLLIKRAGPGPRVLMVGHYDTVFPEGTAAGRPFHMEDGRGFGPGSADMKSGLVTQLASVSLLEPECCDLTVLINGDEESGSVDSRTVIEQQASRADFALVFEPGEPDGAIVVGRPGVRRFRISTHGRAAHSGVEPEKGRNAIEGIAHLALAVQELGRGGDFGTVTVSQITGGTRPNIVPAEASMVVDARVPTDSAGDIACRCARRHGEPCCGRGSDRDAWKNSTIDRLSQGRPKAIDWPRSSNRSALMPTSISRRVRLVAPPTETSRPESASQRSMA